MELTSNKTVGQIVADDYRAATIFEKYGIDFCCKGNRSIADACDLRQVNAEDVIKEIEALSDTNGGCCIDFRYLPASLLADHIEEKHHTYVREKTPIIMRYLEKVCSVHGGLHPELLEVYNLFIQTAAELNNHMQKEEKVLFPRIRKLTMQEAGIMDKNMPFNTSVKSPIHMMRHEHDVEGNRFRQIDMLTDHYTPPADACNTYKVTFALLREFENDLHLHIHLENNLLFPKALEMEERLMN